MCSVASGRLYRSHRGSSMKHLLSSTMALTVALTAVSAEAAVIRVPSASFVAEAGVITFDGSGTNPSYNPRDYGGGAGAPVLHTGGGFLGASLRATPGVDCPGGPARSRSVGTAARPQTTATTST